MNIDCKENCEDESFWKLFLIGGFFVCPFIGIFFLIIYLSLIVGIIAVPSIILYFITKTLINFIKSLIQSIIIYNTPVPEINEEELIVEIYDKNEGEKLN